MAKDAGAPPCRASPTPQRLDAVVVERGRERAQGATLQRCARLAKQSGSGDGCAADMFEDQMPGDIDGTAPGPNPPPRKNPLT